MVDTGIHAFGWSRAQAIDRLMSCTALDASGAATEVDRYIADPGQATSYLIGRIELQRLRAGAAERLGSSFSVRAFHDTVLGNGSVPLDELTLIVERWVERSAAGR